MTPLYTASARGDVEMVKLLLAAPGINVNPWTSKVSGWCVVGRVRHLVVSIRSAL